jgi:hypothetical protein
MRTLEGDNYKPYTHQISLSFPVINKLFETNGFQTAVASAGKGLAKGHLWKSLGIILHMLIS